MPKDVPLTPSHRKAISQGQIARHKRNQELVVAEPTHKRCTKCGKTKPLNCFTPRKRKLASGEIKTYPAGECKKCAAKRSAAHREKLRREGLLKTREKEYNSRRDSDHKREYNREYQTIKRREEGAQVRGAWKKYRRERRIYLDPELLFHFLEELIHRHGRSAVALAAGFDESYLRRLMDGEEPLTLVIADRILCGLGYPELLATMYPEED